MSGIIKGNQESYKNVKAGEDDKEGNLNVLQEINSKIAYINEQSEKSIIKSLQECKFLLTIGQFTRKIADSEILREYREIIRKTGGV